MTCKKIKEELEELSREYYEAGYGELCNGRQNALRAFMGLPVRKKFINNESITMQPIIIAGGK